MKKIILATAFVAVAPAAAFADNCSWDTYWSDAQQTCVSFTEMTAETVESFGQGTSVQPYTEATATYIRNFNENSGGTASQQ